MGRRGTSISRACRIVNLPRSKYYKKESLKREERQRAIEALLVDWSAKFPHYGFWKLYHRLKAKNYGWNHKLVYKLYCRLKLNLRKRPKRKKLKRERSPLAVPIYLNDTWSMDFLSDSFGDGRKFRVFSLMDHCSRQALAIEADTSIPSERVIRILNRTIQDRGKPCKIRVDNGPEFISKKLSGWAAKQKIKLVFIQPGKPTQNGFIERLNGTIRREVLDRFWFTTLKEAREQLWEWSIEYNRHRPHSGIGHQVPDNFARSRSVAV